MEFGSYERRAPWRRPTQQRDGCRTSSCVPSWKRGSASCCRRQPWECARVHASFCAVMRTGNGSSTKPLTARPHGQMSVYTWECRGLLHNVRKTVFLLKQEVVKLLMQSCVKQLYEFSVLAKTLWTLQGAFSARLSEGGRVSVCLQLKCQN